MAKTAYIKVQVDPELKSQAEELYSRFGMSVEEAIHIFLHVSLMAGGLPFEVRQPRYNAETEAAMEEARGIAEGTNPAARYTSAKEMTDSVLAEDPADV